MLIPLMVGAKQVGILPDRGPHDSKTAPQDQPTHQEWIEIDSELSTVTIMALGTPLEDSCSQVIRKFHHPISLDYRAYHRLQG